MKKTHSANIGGTIFHVEEDAYELLQDYLQSIQMHFHSYPDVAEIVADIEGRIAEQLLQRDGAPQVVRLGDVERVIAAMGRIEQFADIEAAPAMVSNSKARKLFRDPDQKIVAGVAAGLASYLGVAPLLVRLLFVLLVPLFGIAAVVYLLLWALVPMASTTTDKLQMRGRPLTLASIDQGARDSIEFARSVAGGRAAQGVTAVGSLIYLVVVSCARALKWVASILVVGGAAITVLILTVLLVLTLVNAGASPMGPLVADFFNAFGTWQHAVKVFFYLLAVIPLALIITTALKLFWGVRHLNTRGIAGMLGVWVVSLLATTAVWASHYPELRRHMESAPAMEAAYMLVNRLRTLVAATSPLSEEQSKALLATFAAEYAMWADHYGNRNYAWMDADAQLKYMEVFDRMEEESRRRVVEAAASYLNAQQLEAMKESMTYWSAVRKAELMVWQKRVENRCSRNCGRDIPEF